MMLQWRVRALCFVVADDVLCTVGGSSSSVLSRQLRLPTSWGNGIQAAHGQSRLYRQLSATLWRRVGILSAVHQLVLFGPGSQTRTPDDVRSSRGGS